MKMFPDRIIVNVILIYATLLALNLRYSCAETTTPSETTNYLRHSGTKHHVMNLMAYEQQMLEATALKRLTDSLAAYENGTELWGTTVFYDVVPSLYIDPFYAHGTDGRGENQKYFVGTHAIAAMGKHFIIYGAGIDNRPVFENYMAQKFNSSVFAFDCTNSKHDDWTAFEFFPWCIGESKSFGKNIYASDAASKNFTFYPLREIKKKLNHKHVHMLKMDIEGCEWDILEKDIVHGNDEDLPVQLLFELHTEGAKKYYVPPDIVRGKGRRQVTKLFYDLFQRGYRVTHVEINEGDVHCAEFSLLRLHHTFETMAS